LLKPIRVGAFAVRLDLAPDGKTAYVLHEPFGSLTPIRTATGRALRQIRFGYLLSGLAFTPDSKTAFVAAVGGILTPIHTAPERSSSTESPSNDPASMLRRKPPKDLDQQVLTIAPLPRDQSLLF
jgi:hypothetical protein